VRTLSARYRRLILASAGVVLGFSVLHRTYFDPLRKAQTYAADLRECWGRKAPLDTRLVFLAMDKDSVQLDSLFPEEVEASPALALMKGGFPWSREVYALAAERLIQAGARVVIFDLLFPARGTGDAAFRDALNKYREQVVVGCDFVAEHTAEGGEWRLDLPVETLIERTRPLDPRLGYVTFWSDPDGAVRRVRMRTSLEDLSASKVPSGEIFESLEARTLRRLGRPDLIPDSDRLFRFAGGPHTIVPHPIYEIFVPDLWSRNYRDGKFFKDKIVFVGPEGSWSHDEHATPFRIVDGDAALMAGPEIHLNALNAALHRDFLTDLGTAGKLAAFILAGIVGGLISLPRGPVLRLGLTVLVLLLYGRVVLEFYNRNGLMLPIVLPIGIITTIVVTNVIVDYRRERKEKTEIRSTLSRYVGQNVVDQILNSPEAFLHSLSGVRKSVTVMFSDLRDFTGLTANLPPSQLITQLNEYFSVMTDAVMAENGTIDKLMGDGMMAVWGNLATAGPEADAHAALRCALAMRAALQNLNTRWRAQGWPVLRFGLGLNHGVATIGNIGSERKMDFTAIGEVVNAASRIEQLTGQLDHDILLGSTLADLGRHTFEIESAGSVKMKGFAGPVSIFRLIGPFRPKTFIGAGESAATPLPQLTGPVPAGQAT
jgi:adenylate cyclase